jgi:hypothetical protein
MEKDISIEFDTLNPSNNYIAIFSKPLPLIIQSKEKYYVEEICSLSNSKFSKLVNTVMENVFSLNNREIINNINVTFSPDYTEKQKEILNESFEFYKKIRNLK